MDPFFAGMPPATALVLAALSRELYDTRQMRRQLLSDTRCTCADAVLQAITDGRLPEHPGWEAWLSLQLLERHERHLQTRLDWRCRHPAAEAEPDGFDDSAALAGLLQLPGGFLPPQHHPDGVALRGPDGLEVLVRWVSPQAWSVEWTLGDAHWRLDTAPAAHAGVTASAHLHRPDGAVVDSPLVLDDTMAPLQRIVDALARSPRL